MPLPGTEGLNLMQILLIVITALLTTGATLATSYFVFVFYLKQRLYREIDELSLVMKAKLREGVLEAGQELLPEFREEVREGFKEAVNQSLSGEFLEYAAKNVAKNSTSIVEQGLSFFLGAGGRPPGTAPFRTEPFRGSGSGDASSSPENGGERDPRDRKPGS